MGIGYKVVRRSENRLLSSYIGRDGAKFAEVEYIPGQYVSSKCPIFPSLLCFKNLESAIAFFYCEDYDDLEIWSCEYKEGCYIPWHGTLEMWELLNGGTSESHGLWPDGTVFCESIKLLEIV